AAARKRCLMAVRARFVVLAALAGTGLLAASCMTPSEKKAMRDDMFNVQTRLLALEQNLVESSKEVRSSGDSAAKRIASTKADMERIERELQQIRGELDALRVGVSTG